MAYKKVFLLSHTLSSLTPCYGGKKDVVVQAIKQIKLGDSCNTKKISLSLHAGTHVDVPFHFIGKGRKVLDIQPCEWFFSKVNLVNVQVKAGHLVVPKDMPRLTNCELLLIKTGFEKYRQKEIYWRNSPGLSPEMAVFLRKKCPSLRAIGVDFISISSLSDREAGRKAHKDLLGNDILLIEDMRLSFLKSAPGRVLVSPIFVEDADGAPCTVWGFKNL